MISPPAWRDVTAVFGGTFDPPHVGHQTAARGLLRVPGVRRVVVLPSASPPQKPCVATADQRAEMARICFERRSQPEITLDLREVHRARADGRPSYTFDTLRELRNEHPELAFVIGTDQLEKLPTWYRFPEILGMCHWLVLERKPFGSERIRQALGPLLAANLIRPAPTGAAGPNWSISSSNRQLIVAPTDAPELSSTSIRETIVKTGEPTADQIPAEVLAYLKLHRIYGTTPASKI